MNNKINWIEKLGSRKFWALLAGLVIAILLMLGADDITQERVTGAIVALGSIVAYILGESKVDASIKEKNNDKS